MKSSKFLVRFSFAGCMALSLAGTALANTVRDDGTGPNSHQSSVIYQDGSRSSASTTLVSNSNSAIQATDTGVTNASENTRVSRAGSGDATNNSTSILKISSTKHETSTCECTKVAAQSGINESTGVLNAGTATQTLTPGRGVGSLGSISPGLVQASQTALVATLPEVGALVPVDVSALRSGYRPTYDAPITNLQKASSGSVEVFLIIASILSLFGAAGSAVYASRRSKLGSS